MAADLVWHEHWHPSVFILLLDPSDLKGDGWFWEGFSCMSLMFPCHNRPGLNERVTISLSSRSVNEPFSWSRSAAAGNPPGPELKSPAVQRWILVWKKPQQGPSCRRKNVKLFLKSGFLDTSLCADADYKLTLTTQIRTKSTTYYSHPQKLGLLLRRHKSEVLLNWQSN